MSSVIQLPSVCFCELQAQLDKKGVSLEVDSAAHKWLAEKGYDKSMGARPMSRVIQEHIKKPLANEILFGSLTKGGNVRVSVDDKEGELSFTYDSKSTEPVA